MPIDDLARSEVLTADTEQSIADVASTMDEESVGSVVVTDGDAPIGIVTDRDLTVRVLSEQADPSGLTVGDVMTADLYTIERSAGFYDATSLMSEHGIRRLPVVEDGSLVGIITADDLTELLADEEQQLAEVIRAQRPAY